MPITPITIQNARIIDNFYLWEAIQGINNGRQYSQFRISDNYWLYLAYLSVAPSPGSVHFKGFIDASTNPDYPAAVLGDQYEITVKGKIGGAAGLPVEAGDLIEANVDTPSGDQAAVGANWIVTQFGLQQIFEITGNDLSFAVLNDLNQSVGNDWTVAIANDWNINAGNDLTWVIGNDWGTFVGGNFNMGIVGTFGVSGTNFVVDPAGLMSINAGSPSSTIDAKGQGSSSATYLAVFVNSSSADLMAVRNDGFVGIGVTAPTTLNGGGIGQLECTTLSTTGGSVALMRTAGANYIDYNRTTDLYMRSVGIGGGSPSIKLAFQATTGLLCVGDGADLFFSSNTNRFFVVQASSGIDNSIGVFNNQASAVGNGCSINFYANSDSPQRKIGGAISSITTDNVNATFSGDMKVQAVLNGSLVDVIVAKSSGTVAMIGLKIGNAGLSTGDLYVDTTGNIVASADLFVAQKQ